MVNLTQHIPYFYKVLLLSPQIELVSILSFYLLLIFLSSALLTLLLFLFHQFQLMYSLSPSLLLCFKKREVIEVSQWFCEARKSVTMGRRWMRWRWATVTVIAISSKFFGFSFKLLQHVLLDDIVTGLVLLYHSLTYLHPFESERVLLSVIAGVLYFCPSDFTRLSLLLNSIDSHLFLQQTTVLLIP